MNHTKKSKAKAKFERTKARETPERGVSGKRRKEWRDENPELAEKLALAARKPVLKGIDDGYPHSKDHDDGCEVCVSPHRALIEACYVEHRDDMVEFDFGLAHAESMGKHVEACAELKAKRLANTDAVWQMIIEKGAEQLKSGDMEVKPEMLTKALAHVDDKSGAMPQRGKDRGEKFIVVMAPVPLPGGGVPGMGRFPVINKPTYIEDGDDDA